MLFKPKHLWCIVFIEMLLKIEISSFQRKRSLWSNSTQDIAELWALSNARTNSDSQGMFDYLDAPILALVWSFMAHDECAMQASLHILLYNTPVANTTLLLQVVVTLVHAQQESLGNSYRECSCSNTRRIDGRLYM